MREERRTRSRSVLIRNARPRKGSRAPRHASSRLGCPIAEIGQAWRERSGQQVARSTIVRLLERQGWRKVVPRLRHPKADLAAQAAYKKKLRRALRQEVLRQAEQGCCVRLMFRDGRLGLQSARRRARQPRAALGELRDDVAVRGRSGAAAPERIHPHGHGPRRMAPNWITSMCLNAP